MIYSQWLLGVPFIVGVGVGALRFITGVVEPDTGIYINSLTFVNAPEPAIVQDRDVITNGKIVAKWSATIRADGIVVCNGGGYWDYPEGSARPAIPINDWVGDDACWKKIPFNVTLQACAKYEWADDKHTEACSLGFKKVIE